MFHTSTTSAGTTDTFDIDTETGSVCWISENKPEEEEGVEWEDDEWWRLFPRFFQKTPRLKSAVYCRSIYLIGFKKRWNKLRQKQRLRRRLRYRLLSRK